MTDRYIIIVDRDGLLIPIVNSDDEGIMAAMTSRDQAERVASETMLCRAYPYSIINFDEVAV